MSSDSVDVQIIASQNADAYYGCVPLDKSNAVVVAGGAPTDVEFQIRDGNGNPVDLSVWFDDSQAPDEQQNRIGVRFALADNSIVANHDVPANVTDAKNGLVQFTIPEFVYSIPCIYYFYFSIFDQTGDIPLVRHIFPGRGVLLVEWSPWMDHLAHCPIKHRVVPALEDVRRKLDDFASKNDLLHQVEFSGDDIVHAMVRPVHIFNETPPQLRRFTFSLSTFPFYDNWVIGTAAELMQIAVMHYIRNKMQSSHGGVQGDEKGRDREYLQLAQMFKEEYQNWVRVKKHELNFSQGQGWGTMHSDFIHYR